MSKKTIVLVAVLVFLLGGSAVFGFLMWKHKDDASGSPVSFTVNAEGWSEVTSSPIPLHIVGETVDKKKVDKKYFVGKSENDLVLQPGTYMVEVYASPVNGDGGMYKTPEPIELVIPENTGKPSASADSDAEALSAEINLSPVPASEITDEEIEKAQAAMKDAGLDEAEINTFVDAARQAREKEKLAEEYAKIAGEYLGFSGSDGYGTLYVSADGSTVYRFRQYNESTGEEENFEYPLTFTSINECAPGKYQVTFAEDFNYAYEHPSSRQDISAGTAMGIDVNDTYQPFNYASSVCP